MVHLHHTSNFLGLLLIKNRSGSFSFTYNCLTKVILGSVRLLLAYNLINGYTINKKNHFTSTITVFLKYETGVVPILKNIQILSKPGNCRVLTLKKMKQLVARNTQHKFIMVSTSVGILTAQECLKKRIGGFILCNVSL